MNKQPSFSSFYALFSLKTFGLALLICLSSRARGQLSFTKSKEANVLAEPLDPDNLAINRRVEFVFRRN